MIPEQIYCIRSFGAMRGRFNFSNLQQPTEGKVNRKKRSESTFSALTSIIHVQGLHSHYQQLPSYTHKHTLPAFILLWDHTQLCPAPALPISQPLLWEAWMPPLNRSSVKGVFPPWSTKLGLVFFQVFLSLSCWPLAADKAFLSVRELQNQECGLDIYAQRNIQCFCSPCDCAVSWAFQLAFSSLCPPVDTYI